MAKQAIVNSSPLIFLSKAGYIDLLKIIADEILVPTPVILEINRRGGSDITVQALKKADWLYKIDVELEPLIQAWDLGIGETGVLSYALANQGTRRLSEN